MVVARHAVGRGGRGLVDEVEAEALRGNAPVAPREDGPVVAERVQRCGILPEVEGLRPLRIDRVPRRAVEVQTDVNPVAPPEIHGPVDLGEHRLVQPIHVVPFDPQRIAHGKADKVKPPAGDPLEVILRDVPCALRREKIQQVEAAPFGQRIALA